MTMPREFENETYSRSRSPDGPHPITATAQASGEECGHLSQWTHNDRVPA